jgi:catecholate siderophore receptor
MSYIVSKKRPPALPLVTAFSSAMAMATVPALAQPPEVLNETPTELPTVTIDADIPGYQATSINSPKFTQPLRDTPQTIQVITNQVFTQQGATTLTEALRNSAGVGTFYAGENGNTTTGDAIYMRGFDTSNSLFVDGIRDLGSISRDLFNIERVEVTKGPAGTDNGRSAPTGAINLATKQPFLENVIAGTVTTGTDGQERATLDVNQTLSGLSGSALRINVLWQDSDVPGRAHINHSRVGIAPSLGLNLDGDTRAYLNLLYVKQDNVPDGYVPTVGLRHWTPQPGLEPLVNQPVDSENFYGTREDHDDVTASMATLRVEHDFSDRVKLTNTLRWGETRQDYLLSAFMSTGGVDDEGNPTGNIRWTHPADLSTYTLARSNNTFKDIENRILTDQLNLRVDFATGILEHNLSAGVELIREEQTSYGIASSGSRPATSLYQPDWNDVGNLSSTRSGAVSEGQTDTLAAYLFDTVKFGERFLVTGGVRADRYQTDYFNAAICNNGSGRGAVDCGGLPVGSKVTTIDAQVRDTLINWKLGAVYKPIPAASFYANYALSQQPPGGANFQLSQSANSADNPNLDPQKAKTYEVGAKWSLADEALTLNLALFRTDITHEINSLELDEQGNPTQTGEKQVDGVELSAVGNITDNWSITAGYTRLDATVETGSTVTADGTPNLSYTPDEAFTSWTTYRFSSGLMIGGGASYTGGLHRGRDGAVGTPAGTDAYTVVNAVVAYRISPNATLRLNAYNLFDKDYVAAINKSGYRYVPGTPRTLLVSADFIF